MPTLLPRDYYYDCYYQGSTQYCRTSAWNDWIRWVVLAVIIIGFLFIFVLCSCLTARRRRKAGRQPFYGTGWAARPGQNVQPYYNNQPAPPYTPQPQPTYGANQGYYGQQPYGQQQQGVELQSPQPTYARGGDAVYTPPAGPPPGKTDGVVR